MKNRYPTSEELRAFEREAHRLRAEEMARLIRSGTDAVRALFRRAVAVRNAKGLRHA